MGNCGYDQNEAGKRIADGDADVISFGRPYISNPDLVEKFASGEELVEVYPMEFWYSHDAEGFTEPPAG